MDISDKRVVRGRGDILEGILTILERVSGKSLSLSI